MIQKIKSSIAVLALALTLAVPAALPAVVYAAECSEGTIAGSISKGSTGAATGQAQAGCDSTGVDDGSIVALANKVVNLISIIVGAIAVIMIIVGGFRYITSGGDSGRVGGAKNTIIYAIIGLIIVALAQIIVKFVLNQTTSAI